ncbi:MAG: VCBS repeat-containing protein [Planctomycetes bacterium]|nr:VCBS repeat-containing protein [Planctomycetota bacterium]
MRIRYSILTLLSGFCSTGIVAAQVPQFGGVAVYPAGRAPSSLVLADFNHDGVDDAAYIEIWSGFTNKNAVGVQLGDGTGGFLTTVDYNTGIKVFGLIAGDFNNDGNVDIYEFGDPISASGSGVLLGTGAGGFGAAMFAPAWAAGTSSGVVHGVAAVDQNFDGKLDVVGAVGDSALFSTTNINLITMPGNGDGTFAPITISNIAFGANSNDTITLNDAASGDLDNDGRLDCACVTVGYQHNPLGGSNLWTQKLRVAIANNTNGFTQTFTTDIYSSTFVAPAGVSPASCDANGDHNLDIVLSNGSVYLGDGNGNIAFTPSMDIQGGVTTTADLNQDGYPDLLTISGTLKIRKTIPGAAANAPVEFGGFTGSVASAAATDLNGDGRADLVLASNTPMGSFTSAGHLLTAMGNGDARLQTVAGFAAPLTLILGNGSAACAASADMNHDGNRDLILCDTGNVMISNGDGSGGFGAGTVIFSGSGLSACAIGDLDRDGNIDIAVASSTANTVQVLLVSAPGLYLPLAPLSVGTSPVSITFGDVNGDGALDIATANILANSVSLLLASPAGFIQNPDSPAPSSPVGIALGDLNEDGFDDAAVCSSNTKFAAVLLGSGSGFLPMAAYPTTGNTPWGVAVADLNDDGHADVAIANTSSCTIFAGDGAGSLGQGVDVAMSGLGNLPNSIRQMVPSELSGDGSIDLWAGGAGTGASIAINNQTGVFDTTFAIGGFANTTNARSRFVIADLDGDGRADAFALGDVQSTVRLNATPAPYGTSSYGTGTPGCAGVHGIVTNVAPRVGTPGFVITSTNGPRNMLGLGIFGDVGNPSGFDAFGLGFINYVDPYLSAQFGFFSFVSDSNGSSASVVSISNDPTLAGQTFTVQTIVLWTDGCLPTFLGLSSSRALVVTIQN